MEIYQGILKITKKGSGVDRHKVAYKDSRGRSEKITVEPAQRAYGADVEDGACVSIAIENGIVISCALAGSLAEKAELERMAGQIAAEKKAPPKPAPTARESIRANPDSRFQNQKRDSRGYKPSGGAKGRPVMGRAPYNFAAYVPDLVLAPPADEGRKWSGSIECELTALTPLLIAGRHEEGGNRGAICGFLQADGKYLVPGSSLKGMLRSLVEILSYSGLRPMNHKKLFWRDITAKEIYLDLFGDTLKGGFLRRHGAEYQLTPVKVAKDSGRGVRLLTGSRIRPRKPSVYYFQEPGPGSQSRNLDYGIVERLWDQLTPDQEGRENVKNRERLLVRDPGLPVFYREENGEIVELGFCRYFRIAYRYSPYDLAWPDKALRHAPDWAESIFGHAGHESELEKEARAGRVAVESFTVSGREQIFENVVLGGPKPTCVPFYLRQNPEDIRTISGGTKNRRSDMVDYNNPRARLRGRKLYWHHKPVPASFPRNEENQKVTVSLRPLREGAQGVFRIHVRSLTESELGCLFEALALKEGCCHKLGMGRPLGFGSVRIRIRDAFIMADKDRYASLAARMGGSQARMPHEERERLREKFRARIYEAVKARGCAGSAKDYYELEPISQLNMILSWTEQPAPGQADYMSLAEFGRNLILPEPGQVPKMKNP